MSNQTAGLLMSALLIASAAPAIPPLPDEQPDIFVEEPTPELPDAIPESPMADDIIDGVDPTRVGLIREDAGTRYVALVRPMGVAQSCQWTVCNAPAGSRWLGADERRYEKLADGTFRLLLTAQQRADGMLQPSAALASVGFT
jgi:hypothetical protein